jgi:hypothetical protein
MAIAAAYVPMAIAGVKAAHDKKEAGLPLTENVPGAAIHSMVPAVKPQPATEDAPVAPLSLAQLPLALGVLVLGFLALPVVIGISSPLSILIFGFGLYQAWKVNKATPVAVTGPHWRMLQAPPLPV